ncbi:beta-L-arabinofuranosidase domain-containing protein [Caulobacter hibisci]|uniref:Glycoside hydrolase family 127 protein n=1 Tax=Caulobacter hibisci TaxID=2035993 RepID=A0ABS0T0E4_9CAUL|nr:beta-L-arabinofuranosidase domain-containing protein [Caulobacter hibisci]MBI1684991.1 glycoside hydrolase family 127 protein [Caulobacter hibisci]
MVTRRGFLAAGCCAACSTPAFGALAASGKAKPGLSTFAYDRVRLGPGKMQDQLAHQHRLFMGLDDDRLLKPFRQRAGLPAPGADMGGWYDDSADFHIDVNDWSTANWHGYIPGHSFGQYVSGLSRYVAITGDPATREKVRGLVTKYADTISPRFFAGYTLPAYTYDKIVIGLIDAYRYAGIKEAGPALDKVTDAVLPVLPEKALTREERRQRPYASEAEIWDEPYTLPENLFLAWELGLGERYKDLALRYMQDAALFDPLARGQSPLAGKHAYSHVNALNSAIQAWYATGDEKYLKAARNGFDFVVRQSFATGGWGPNEELVGPDDTETLLKSLTETHRTFETPCGAYGHFKIARSLLQITKDPRYGDSMERVLYNTILGAKDTTPKGETFYYSDYSDTASKFYRDELWPCCSGTFIQLAADYGISAYLRDGARLYVNLYVPSTLKASVGDLPVSLRQDTRYPLEPTTEIAVDPARAGRFSLMLRVPAWAGAGSRILVNGQPAGVAARPGTFVELDRVWWPGDKVRLLFDMAPRLEPLNAAHPEVVALMTGPLALFPLGHGEVKLTRAQWLSARQQGAEWRAGNVAFKPFMAIGDETYRLYGRLV